MARLKVRTHEITVYFCGKCGKIMKKNMDILSKCDKCGEIIEP
jgi:DNA-directed RNA polymerase subunit RPC12/RpoP